MARTGWTVEGRCHVPTAGTVGRALGRAERWGKGRVTPWGSTGGEEGVRKQAAGGSPGAGCSRLHRCPDGSRTPAPLSLGGSKAGCRAGPGRALGCTPGCDRGCGPASPQLSAGVGALRAGGRRPGMSSGHRSPCPRRSCLSNRDRAGPDACPRGSGGVCVGLVPVLGRSKGPCGGWRQARGPPTPQCTRVMGGPALCPDAPVGGTPAVGGASGSLGSGLPGGVLHTPGQTWGGPGQAGPCGRKGSSRGCRQQVTPWTESSWAPRDPLPPGLPGVPASLSAGLDRVAVRGSQAGTQRPAAIG